MEKFSLLTFFEVLSNKIIGCFFLKNKISTLGFRLPNLFYFSPQSQNATLRKRYPYNKISKSGHEGLLPPIRSVLMFLVVSFFGFTTAVAQTLPPASSCTSKDLELVEATLPGVGICGNCTPGTPTTRTLYLSINNKTGSLRTAFAFWGTLKVYNADGTLKSTTSISGCNGTIQPSSINTLPFGTITYLCGESLQLTDLFLAWTTSNKKENCDFLKANSATINPKCGTLPSIQIFTGLDASAVATDATCIAGGSILVTPFGGKSPYSVGIGTDIRTGVTGSTNFTDLPAAPYTIYLTDANNCTASKSRTVGSASTVTANAGDEFTKTCIANTSGKQIGEASATGFTYSWSPATGLSDASASDPTANPSATTTYTVTKTKTSSGCTDTASVIVTVDNAAVTVSAGSAFTKTCLANTSGATIGETAVTGYTYSWSPATGLSDTSASDSTANPSATTTYTVTKTKTSGVCSNTASVIVTVDKTAPTAGAGSDVTINCATPSTTLAATGAGSYSWSPSAGLSATNISNPTATPSVTTTYTVTVTGANGCIATDDVIVTVDTAKPDTPTFCVVQPSLCSTDKGSVTINSPCGEDYEYSIKDGDADTWYSKTVFSNLNPGDVTGIRVRNVKTGCVSNAASCDASNCSASPCSATTAKTIDKVASKETSITSKTETVGFDAYPVPFKDQLTIKYNFDYVSDVKIEVFNAQGISVLSKKDTNSYLNKEITLDLRLNKGKEQVYVVKVTTNRGSSTKKVMSSK